MSLATKLFDNLSLPEIQALIAQGQEEHLHLDFKMIARPDLTDRQDKKSLAVALSGFSNSDGGVVVWGVNARPNAQGVDCAVGEAQIVGLRQFVAKLNEFTGQFVSPVVDGVRHVPIPIAGDAGFAASLVPASDSGPHMAKAGEDRYYKRAGSAFYRLEHFDIADMFGRRQRPRLNITATVRGSGSSGGGGVTEYKGRVIVGLENTGRGLARFPYLALDVLPPFEIDRYGVDGNGGEGLPRLRAAGSTVVVYGGNADIVIHPGTSRDIAALSVGVKVGADGRITVPPPLTLAAGMAAEGIPLEQQSLIVPPEQLMAAILPDRLYHQP